MSVSVPPVFFPAPSSFCALVLSDTGVSVSVEVGVGVGVGVGMGESRRKCECKRERGGGGMTGVCRACCSVLQCVAVCCGVLQCVNALPVCCSE